MTTTSADMIRRHLPEAELMSGNIGTIRAGQKGIATDTSAQVHRMPDGTTFLRWSEDTFQVLTSGSNELQDSWELLGTYGKFGFGATTILSAVEDLSIQSFAGEINIGNDYNTVSEINIGNNSPSLSAINILTYESGSIITIGAGSGILTFTPTDVTLEATNDMILKPYGTLLVGEYGTTSIVNIQASNLYLFSTEDFYLNGSDHMVIQTSGHDDDITIRGTATDNDIILQASRNINLSGTGDIVLSATGNINLWNDQNISLYSSSALDIDSDDVMTLGYSTTLFWIDASTIQIGNMDPLNVAGIHIGQGGGGQLSAIASEAVNFNFNDEFNLTGSNVRIYNKSQSNFLTLDSRNDIRLSAESNIQLSADTLSVSTTYEVNAFSLDSSGNAGFGTTTPKFDVSASFNGNQKAITVYSETNPSTLELVSSAGSGTIGAISFIANANSGVDAASNKVIAQIRSGFETDGYPTQYEDGGDLGFYTKQYEGGSLALRMLIDDDGDIGVNTPTPGYKFDVNGTGRFASHLYANGNLTVGGSFSPDTLLVTSEITSFGTNQTWNIDSADESTVSATFHFCPVINGHTNAAILVQKLDVGTAIGNQESSMQFQLHTGNVGNPLMTTIYQRAVSQVVRVGINTVLPTETLDVSGNANFTGTGHFTDTISTSGVLQIAEDVAAPSPVNNMGQIWTSAATPGDADKLMFTDANGVDYLVGLTAL